MMLINLLPHREAARQRRKKALQTAMGAAVTAGLFTVAAAHGWLRIQTDRQQNSNAYLEAQTAVLNQHIQTVNALQADIAALRERQLAVQALQARRDLPVHLLDGLARHLPQGVYLSALRQQGLSVEMRGVAQSSEHVSELLRSLSSHAPWLVQPELKEIVAGTLAVPTQETRHVVHFSLGLGLALPWLEGAAAGEAP